jgi:hypothetical protein
VFVGHYGVSLAAKRWAPGLSLGWMFLAVQALDVLFGAFVLLGIEKMAIVPGFTAYNPYDLVFMPYSHSLVGALAWSALLGLVTLALLRRRVGGVAAAIAIAVAVFSHWLLDVPMHTADMPLAGNQTTKLGLGLWQHRELSLAAELVALWAGALIWLRAPSGVGQRRGTALVLLGVLTVVLLTTPFMPVPPSAAAFAVQALVAYVGIAGVAAWVDWRVSRAHHLG